MAKEYDFRGKLFYVDPTWQKTLSRLDVMERAMIWDAIMEYRLTGEEVSLTGKLSERAEGVYWMLLDTLGRFDEREKALVRARSEAGSKGMASRWYNKDNKDNKDNIVIVDNFVSDDNKDNKDNKHNLTIPNHTIPNHTIPNDTNTSSSIYIAAKSSKLPTPQTEKYANFLTFLQDKTPVFLRNCDKVITEKEFYRLLENCTEQELSKVLEQIENRKDKRKTYANMNLTVRNWLKNLDKYDRPNQ